MSNKAKEEVYESISCFNLQFSACVHRTWRSVRKRRKEAATE
jgi:hypothetical protein